MSPATEAPPFVRPRCGGELDCNRFAPIVWKDDPEDPETWFYMECDRCDEYTCRVHSMLEGNERVCDLCYQTEAMSRRSSRSLL